MLPLYLSFLTSGGDCTHQALTLPFAPGSEHTPPTHMSTCMCCTCMCSHRHASSQACALLLEPHLSSEPHLPTGLFSARRAAGSVSTLVRPEAICAGWRDPGQGIICQLPPRSWPSRNCKVYTEFPHSMLNPIPWPPARPGCGLRLVFWRRKAASGSIMGM